MSLRSQVAQLWKGLVRQLTPENFAEIAHDDKMHTSDGEVYFYVPPPHYEQATKLFPGAKVVEYLGPKSISEPGLLSLAWEDGRPLQYVVPGGRFNEFYGWDSYFIVLGLLQDGHIEAAKCVLKHQCFEIDYYDKILNANRSYYLSRSQPPFLTDMAIQIFDRTADNDLLVTAMKHAIKEYNTVWSVEPRLDPVTGLSRYNPPPPTSGGHHPIPAEVEQGHFNHVLQPLAEKAGLSIDEFTRKYNSDELTCHELDTYLQHDIAVRESGHDTTTRFDQVCADLATIDLNCLLYRYERDIADMVELLPKEFAANDVDASVDWSSKAQKRKEAILKYLWNEEDNMFYDYNTSTKSQHKFPSVTCLWALWSGVAPKDIAERLVPSALTLFEQPGGLAGTQPVLGGHPRQWDHPSGWAPHQIMAWKGLEAYGFKEDALRLASKWVEMIKKVHNSEGLIYEKYNVVDCSHGVEAEYGNQGTFSEGFGWTNTSVVLGWDLLNK